MSKGDNLKVLGVWTALVAGGTAFVTWAGLTNDHEREMRRLKRECDGRGR